MSCNNNNLYVLSFTVGSESGIALISAASEWDAKNMLRNGGRYNCATPGYIINRCRNIGVTASIRNEILIESYVNALVAYDAIVSALNGISAPVGDASGVVHYDMRQDISELEKSIARDNIGAGTYTKPVTGIPASDLAPDVIPDVPEDVLRYTVQVLTDSQKSQARENIGAGTYSKLSGGIPKEDLSSSVQASLDNADSAYQKPVSGIPASDMAAGVIPSVPEISTNIQSDASSDAKTSSPKAVKTYSDNITGDLSNLTTTAKSNLVAAINEVATSGSDSEAVKYTEQSLTTEQMTQARLNIGAGVGNFSGNPIVSLATPVTPDGTLIATLSNGDTVTIDLNHNHPQYQKCEYLEDESEMPATPDEDTLYLIAEEES